MMHAVYISIIIFLIYRYLSACKQIWQLQELLDMYDQRKKSERKTFSERIEEARQKKKNQLPDYQHTPPPPPKTY